MSSELISAASVAILIYYIDKSRLVLALLLALTVTNDYTIELLVMSTLGLVLLAIIRACIY
jgi:hypothetical protein